MSDHLLTLMQLATTWGWSRSKLYRLVVANAIPHARIGPRNDVYFRESEVETWLEARSVRPTAAPRRAQASMDERDRQFCEEMGIEPDHQFT